MNTAMSQFLNELAELLHQELRTTLANLEGWNSNLLGGGGDLAWHLWGHTWSFIHEWQAKFMNGQPAYGVAQKEAYWLYGSPRWCFNFWAYNPNEKEKS